MSTCDNCHKTLSSSDVKFVFNVQEFAITGKTLREETTLSFQGRILCDDCFQTILKMREP